jgi:E3 ubiquitin-protein ligase RNF213
MNVPVGIAVNQALRENVFMMLTCILNQIPLFVVGKPGSSKSLAMQLIRENFNRETKSKYPTL